MSTHFPAYDQGRFPVPARLGAGNRGRDLSVAASHVEDPLRACEIEQGEHLLGHRLL